MKTTIKLPQDFKKRWIEALRSGEYKQYCGGSIVGIGRDSFCCLGVAAIVNGINLYKADQKQKGEAYNSLPTAINNGFRNPIAVKLIEMNDHHKTFLEIADYIETNL